MTELFFFHLEQFRYQPNVIVLYCMTDGGRAVQVRVHNFYHYFYCTSLPFNAAFNVDRLNEQIHDDIKRTAAAQEKFRTKARRFVPAFVATGGDDDNACDDTPQSFSDRDGDGDRDLADKHGGEGDSIVISDPEHVVQAIEPAEVESIFNYQQGYVRSPRQHCRVVLSSGAAHVRNAARVLQRHYCLNTFEDRALTYEFRFIVDTGLTPGGWFLLEGVSDEAQIKQNGIDVDYRALNTLNSKTNARADIAPLRKLTFDIECESLDGSFPTPEKDPVIQVSTLLARLGRSDVPAVEKVFTWRPTSAFASSVQIVVCADEEEMFMQLCDYIVSDADPDLVIGYNSDYFDLPYLVKRAQHKRWMGFLQLGRIAGSQTYLKSANFSSNAHGTREQTECVMSGRISLDMCEWVRREYKSLRTYTLNAVATRFLGDQKEDIHHSQIARMWNGTPETRSRLAKYCAKDTRLTHRLDEKLLADVRLISMCRVTKCDLNTVIRRGAQIKTTVQIAAAARRLGFVCPFGDKRNNYSAHYEGGLVLDRTPLFVRDSFVLVLDMNSLYPSIMIAYNLSWDTYVPPDQLHKLRREDYFLSPTGDAFVTKRVREGVLPRQSAYLLAKRNEVKKLAAAAAERGDKHMAAIYDQDQIAIKLAGNSIYGYASATEHGHLPLLAIGRSTTALGRETLHSIIRWLREHYPDCEVLYGGARGCGEWYFYGSNGFLLTYSRSPHLLRHGLCFRQSASGNDDRAGRGVHAEDHGRDQRRSVC
jgi:DNA polymerase elongation subunit (family B)